MPKRVVIILLCLTAFGTASTFAGPCDPPIQNPIVCENSLPGNPGTQWDLPWQSGEPPLGDPNLEGFTTDISVNRGATVVFKIKTVGVTSYRIDIYRLGYYGGNGARLVATVNPTLPLPAQPACSSDAATGLYDCGNWTPSASWSVPAGAVSGVYLAKLVRTDGTPSDGNHIVFVVRDDMGASDILLQIPEMTWHAYNPYGGRSLYVGPRAYKVSYNRPFAMIKFRRGAGVFSGTHSMIRFLEQNGYDVSYTTDADTARRGAELLEHDVFLSVAHDEYWSAEQRTNVETAIANGVHVAFFSGNAVFWKTRWEADGTYRTIVCYKTSQDGAVDPNSSVWTGTWRDPAFPGGARPENGLMGTMYRVGADRKDSMTIPSAQSQLRFWRNSLVAAENGKTIPEILAHEWDDDPDNGHRTAGQIRLSESVINVTNAGCLLDAAATYGPCTATHHLTLHKHATSGALVFGAGTVNWVWGLDDGHEGAPLPANPSIRQATVNLLGDMNVLPATLDPALTAATPSTDQSAPTSQITSPASGSYVPRNGPVKIQGTASDTGGGRVAGVEVSVDDGTTWHPATSGLGNWTYTWNPPAIGLASLRSRAIDDSVNVGAASAAVSVRVRVGDTVGVRIGDYRHLRNANAAGNPDLIFGFAGSGTAIACDWDGDGIDTPGFFSNGTWTIRNSNTAGPADSTFTFGSAGDRPVCGDWDGDGDETVGVFTTSAEWRLANTNAPVPADLSFAYGTGSDQPVVGDWNGDGTTTIAVVQTLASGARWWHLRNENSAGPAQLIFQYQYGGTPIAGDWDANGTDTPGAFLNGGWSLRNANTSGSADLSFLFGDVGHAPVAGKWTSALPEK